MIWTILGSLFGTFVMHAVVFDTFGWRSRRRARKAIVAVLDVADGKWKPDPLPVARLISPSDRAS